MRSEEREPGTARPAVEPATPTETGRKGGAIAAPYPGAVAAPTAARTTEAGEAWYLGVSRAGWPAIWAGFFVGTMAYVLFNVLGVALGITWLRAADAGRAEFRTVASIWLIATTLISFFAGGYVTGRMMALPGRGTGALNGFLYGCFSILALAVLSTLPVLGNLPTLATLIAETRGFPVPQMAVSPAEAQSVAWWTFGGLVAALAAGTWGGSVGARHTDVEPLTTGAEPA